MFGNTKANFSERPSYNAGEVDAIFSKYCSPTTVNASKKPGKAGIDVTKRRDAIIKSLSVASKAHIFGELEMSLINR